MLSFSWVYWDSLSLPIRAYVTMSADMYVGNMATVFLDSVSVVTSSLAVISVSRATVIVSAHRRILGMVSVVCVLVKICVSSISLYKLDTVKLTTPFESAHQFTLVCTVSDSKTVLGCHYNSCSNHSFVLTNSYLSLFRAVFSLPGLFLPLLYTDLCLLQLWSEMFFFFFASASKVQLSR